MYKAIGAELYAYKRKTEDINRLAREIFVSAQGELNPTAAFAVARDFVEAKEVKARGEELTLQQLVKRMPLKDLQKGEEIEVSFDGELIKYTVEEAKVEFSDKPPVVLLSLKCGRTLTFPHDAVIGDLFISGPYALEAVK